MACGNKNVFLYLISTIVNLLSFSTGISITWITPILPKLDGTKSMDSNPFGRVITPFEVSWIAGIVPLGAILGPLVAGTISDKIGRKKSLLIIGILNILALLITLFSKIISLFYIARFLAGVALGSSYTVVPTFLAEISENHNRGTLGCIMSIFVATGMNFALIIGPYLSIQNYSLICLIPLLIFIPAFLILSPETPVFLASINDTENLNISLAKFRNKKPENVNLEMSNILEENNRVEIREIRDLFTVTYLRKGLIISVAIVILQQSVGIGAILAYMETIFESAQVDLAPEICSIIVGFFQVLGTILSSTAVDRLGRKFLLLSSSICVCLSLSTLALYFYLKTAEFHVEKISYLPVISLVVFIIAFNVGLGPVPWVVMAELFPSNFTSIAATFTAATCFLTAFIVTVTFPTMLLAMGMATCFFVFSIVCMVGSGFIYTVLPETKGKSLQEIQKIL